MPYIERIHQMSYSSLSDNWNVADIYSFKKMILWSSLKLFSHTHGYFFLFSQILRFA